MEDWLPAGDTQNQSGEGQVQKLVPSFQMQIQLAKIMQRALEELCSLKKRPSKAQIDILNLDLCRWETNLDQSLHWNKWQATSDRICPTIAALQLVDLLPLPSNRLASTNELTYVCSVFFFTA